MLHPGKAAIELFSRSMLHLSFGSLPFADNRYWVRSVYVNKEVLETIKKGRCGVNGESFGGRSLQILRNLPGIKQIDAFYHIVDPTSGKDSKEETNLVGSIFRSNGESMELSIPNLTVRAN